MERAPRSPKTRRRRRRRRKKKKKKRGRIALRRGG